MNKLDERIYKALKFFADKSRAEVTVVFQNNKPQYSQIVPEDIEKSLSESGYISPQAKTRYMITNEGLIELRKLDEMK